MKIPNSCVILAIVVIMGLGSFQISCRVKEAASKAPQKDIMGKWISSDKSLTLKFKTNGKLFFQIDRGNVKINGASNTIFVDDNHLMGVWERSVQVYEVRVYSKKMVLIDDGGKETQFHRVK